ncbi:hypothetical protein NQ317_009218 [Molorchus minor]|uniref:Uncharacterized protein n=1 Tax=Molorchus minor TaxID=1323400 RepID=A0ABQ9J2C7_9CUCU|nr:hypothetical protein NQ317_009218 [Molorchus minor]
MKTQFFCPSLNGCSIKLSSMLYHGSCFNRVCRDLYKQTLKAGSKIVGKLGQQSGNSLCIFTYFGRLLHAGSGELTYYVGI